MAPLSSWSAPLQPLLLEHDQVHVWRVPLDLPMSRVEDLRRTLVAAEVRRAERYRFDRDSRRFIVARGVLREILSRYLGTEAHRLRLGHGPRGKPYLLGETGEGALCFNVAHANELALYAVTRGRKIGVDIEYMERDPVPVGIAERFFSPREVAGLRALPPDVQRQAFFNGWTRKEAYVKATGDGLALPLDQFDVTLDPREPAALLSVNTNPQEASRWTLQSLEPGSGYAAALAVEGRGWRLERWQWEAC